MSTHLKYLPAGFLAWLVSLPLAAQPVNDMFANRTSLTGSNITVQGDNTGATIEAGEPALFGRLYLFYSVWYEWTAPSNGIFYVNARTQVPFPFRVYVYRGTALGALTTAAQTPDGGVEVLQGDMLGIQFGEVTANPVGYTPSPGPFTLTVWETIPAPTSGNDMFANRAEITAPSYHFAGGIYGSSSEPGEPLPAAGETNTLWWHFHAPSDGLWSVTTSTPGFTADLTVYTGANFAAMVPVGSVGSLPPPSSVNYLVHAGQDYFVQMATGYVTLGGFTLDTQFNSQSLTPTNDMFASAAQVAGTNITYYGNFTSATSEPGEPASPASNTVWVAWAAPCTGHAYYIPPDGANQYASLYTGPALALLQPLPVIMAPYIVPQFLAVQGTVYYFQFCGGNDNFLFSLWLIPLTQPVNDNFDQAIRVGGNSPSFGPASVVGATMEPGEPAHAGATPEKSVWWTWQAPLYGTFTLGDSRSLASNVVVAVYTGDAVGTLTLVAKASNSVTFPVVAGQDYQIAGAVPTNEVGDISLAGSLRANTKVHAVPGNLLQEPSWEGTGILGAQYWHWSGSLAGYVGEAGDCDGTTWPVVENEASIWQTFPTVPGHSYAIQFAYSVGGNLTPGDGDALVQVSWDTNVLGVADLPAANSGFWNWCRFSTVASNTTSQVTFLNLARDVEMDAFSVVDQTAPPAIITQPSSQSTELGGTAAFYVNASGTQPLNYQWFFQSGPLDGQTNLSLIQHNVSVNAVGDYYVTISNQFGMVTSMVAALLVEAPTSPTIVLQPCGDTVAPSAYFYISVTALGTQPLSYQWSFNGAAISDATNASLTITNVQLTDAGVYQVVVTNSLGTVFSLPATLAVTPSDQQGGTVLFANRIPGGFAPVFDLDGVTPLNGGCVAQLYAGPSLALLRAVGMPVPFRTGVLAGYVSNTLVTLPTVAPGSNAIVQIRAWDPAAGGTYEQARVLGGKFGKSGLLQIIAGGTLPPPLPPLPPPYLTGLQSFSMHAGLPEFNVGVIQFMNRLPDGSTVWSLTGEPNYIYLVEEAAPDWIWSPYLLMTNTTGTLTFTNSIITNSNATFFRARILD